MVGRNENSSENIIQAWNLQTQKKLSTINTHQEGAITDLSFQPLMDYCVFAAEDKSWSFYDLPAQRCLTNKKSEHQIHCLEFHPDGLMMSTGHQDGSLSIWDIRTQNVFTTIKNDGINGGPVSNISFSNKGYLFAASWQQSNVVKIYDMRKNFSSIPIELPEGENVSSICFDAFGNNIAVAQDNALRVYSGKTWTPQQAEVKASAPISKCVFSPSSFKIVCSL